MHIHKGSEHMDSKPHICMIHITNGCFHKRHIKKNFKFKPALHCLKIDFASHLVHDRKVGLDKVYCHTQNTIYGYIYIYIYLPNPSA